MRLGTYEVVALLGSGGMGEVYRARDTKLGREVAIKILPAAFAVDAERVARFKREAHVVASLNHPHIAQIYGLEEVDGVQFLVMELVAGESLERRIARGPIPVDEALPIAKQIAEALEAAHEKGIIHRDLKPANIALTEDGQVKVLDFGLAKAIEPADASAGSVDLANSPTITSPAMLSGVGVILGTAAYMSPEQAKGGPADKRSDVWTFGCVLYEMLTGRRAFEGEDVSDTLANVLKSQPDWSALPADTPTAIQSLLKGCVERDRQTRVGDVAVARFALDRLTDAGSIVGPQRSRSRDVGLTIAGLMTGAAIAGAALWYATRPAPPRVTRLTIPTTGTSALTLDTIDRNLTITPDGSRVLYVGNRGTQLFVRPLDALDATAIATGGFLRGPFVSPDGQWAGFKDNSELKKVPIAGGPSIPIAILDSPSRGAVWLPDNTIIFTTTQGATGLQRVSANGGTPEVLTKPDRASGEFSHVWPAALPGGRAVLFTILGAGGVEAAQIAALDLDTRRVTVLVRGGSDARYVSSGHLVYAASGGLRAVPFDPIHLVVTGPAVPVAPRIAVTGFGGANTASAADGTLVYADAGAGGSLAPRTLVWVDRAGREEAIAASPRAYVYPRISPDGTRVALFTADLDRDLWVWDLRRATLMRLTLDPSLDIDPIWTPDGTRIIFDSDRDGGQRNVWWQAADGTDIAKRLTTSPNVQIPTDVVPDGRAVIFEEFTPGRNFDIMQLPLTGDRHPGVLLQTTFIERNGTISPDGRWLAYESNASGRYEIYVRPYPNTARGQWQISSMGGTRPLWARRSQELFFISPEGAVVRVPVDARGATWSAGTPSKLFAGPYYFSPGNPQRSYDLSPDGQRFLMIKTAAGDPTATPPQIVVIEHADDELKRLAPPK